MHMHLSVVIGTRKLRALVDADSTHCFITANVVCRIRLVPIPRSGMTVGIANDDCDACDGICPVVRVLIDDGRFFIDFFAITLGGYDVVLDYPWLCNPWTHPLKLRLVRG